MSVEEKDRRKKERDAAYYLRNKDKIVARACAHQKQNKGTKNANNRKWATTNKDKMRSAVNDWRKSNPDLVRDQVSRTNQSSIDETGLSYQTAYRRKNRAKAMLHSAKYRAKIKFIEFSITIDDVAIPERCPVFGFLLDTGLNCGRSDYSPSLDRINNNLGYIKGNVLVVSWLANRIKNDATPEQLRTVADFYADQTKNLRRTGL